MSDARDASDANDARRFFDAIARRYDRVYALSGPESRARVARVVELLAGKTRVLVLGVGTGRELPALLDAGHAPTGLDFSDEMIALCNKRARPVPMVRADFWRPLPFDDAAFDAVIALHGTIAHPPSADRAHFGALARETARVVRDGGAFVAEVPAAERLAETGVAMTSPTTFTHRDGDVAIEGVALDAAGWIAALRPLAVVASPLGRAEHLLVARVARVARPSETG